MQSQSRAVKQHIAYPKVCANLPPRRAAKQREAHPASAGGGSLHVIRAPLPAATAGTASGGATAGAGVLEITALLVLQPKAGVCRSGAAVCAVGTDTERGGSAAVRPSLAASVPAVATLHLLLAAEASRQRRPGWLCHALLLCRRLRLPPHDRRMVLPQLGTAGRE